MIVQDLGEFDAPVLVFGGIYSNLQAFDALLAVADRMGVSPSSMICTGDLVAYCADARAVVDKMRALGIATIKGNCEEQLGAGGDDCGCGFEEGSTCSILSRSWYAHAAACFSQEDRNWMRDLPDRIVFKHFGKRYGVLHGGASDISHFIWPVTAQSEIKHEVDLLKGQVGCVDGVLAGHSGIPMQAQVDGVLWTNSGAIGMPANNGRQETSFAILDEAGVAFHSLTYDAEAARDAMVSTGLTQGYHDTLVTGFWPSQETLPPIMRIRPEDGGSAPNL